ncbi:MAG: DUF5698 domain-containing protein [Dysgonamonadaceae bacterium]|jgi:uncharacterized protein YebE (UPF0316 family)|nr:DUF5698 domain-containing protein [Dysgonamonadaceae bacterium]
MLDFLDQYPYLLPVFIFFGRLFDVTLGTLRVIFVSKGEKNKAPIIGFFEVLIWIIIISQIFSRANDWIAYLSFAAGYASGSYVGILIENRIAFGVVLCRIYTQKNGMELVQSLNRMNFGATMTRGEGSQNEVHIIETVINRKQLRLLEQLLTEFDPNIFYVVEDVRTKQNGIFAKKKSFLSLWRIGK